MPEIHLNVTMVCNNTNNVGSLIGVGYCIKNVFGVCILDKFPYTFGVKPNIAAFRRLK